MEKIVDQVMSGNENVLEALPVEILDQIVRNYLSGRDIARLCTTSKYFNDTFCQDWKLWEYLIFRDYPYIRNAIPELEITISDPRRFYFEIPNAVPAVAYSYLSNLNPKERLRRLFNLDPEVSWGYPRNCYARVQPIVFSEFVAPLISRIRSQIPGNILYYRGLYYVSPIGSDYPYVGLKHGRPPVPCLFRDPRAANRSIEGLNKYYGVDAKSF